MIEFVLPIRVVPKHDGGEWKRDAERAKRLQDNEAAIRKAAESYRPLTPLTGPLIVDTWFVLHVTKTVRLSPNQLAAGCEPHTIRPDADNMRKQLLDALQQDPKKWYLGFFLNDSQVCGGVELKTWGPKDEVRIRIREATAADVAAMWDTMKG